MAVLYQYGYEMRESTNVSRYILMQGAVGVTRDRIGTSVEKDPGLNTCSMLYTFSRQLNVKVKFTSVPT
jgi:hypothetical protein